MHKLSVIIPCYNESATIREILGRVIAAPTQNWEKEIIVVDDASTDGTQTLLEEFWPYARIVCREKNGGKGSAVREGLVLATGSHVLIQDADLEYDPEEIQHLLEVIDRGEAEVVYGSRNLRPREREGALIPRLGVWSITKLINALHGQHLTDVWTCYKLFPSEAAGEFVPGRFESELLFTAALSRRGYRFLEVPISYHPRDASAGKKIRYRDGIWAIAILIADWMVNGGVAKRTASIQSYSKV